MSDDEKRKSGGQLGSNGNRGTYVDDLSFGHLGRESGDLVRGTEEGYSREVRTSCSSKSGGNGIKLVQFRVDVGTAVLSHSHIEQCEHERM
jgi:hypothetical protein